MNILRYGNTNTYFYNGLLIDTDMPGTVEGLYKELKRNGLYIEDVKYVIATHYHPDHMGLIGELMSCGISLLLPERQINYVHSYDQLLRKQSGNGFIPINENDAVIISCDKSRDYLAKIGIKGEIIGTESHSADGIALITDDGYCFAGDLEPMQYTGGYEDDSLLKKDWEKILEFGKKRYYFGHINEQEY